MPTLTKDSLPLYGSVTGVLLTKPVCSIVPGISLRRGIFDIFSTPMMGFKVAPEGSHTPGPWVAVDGAYHSFESRAELVIESLATLNDITPVRAAWFVAILLRLRIEAPVRISAIANVPLGSLEGQHRIWPESFEASPYQNGLFRAGRLPMEDSDLDWISTSLEAINLLASEDRFLRALTIFDESIWTSRLDTATVLIWTAIEVLLGCGGERNKTKAICSGLSGLVSRNRADRDRAYSIIRDLYEKRGGVVHGGRQIERDDFGQLYALARVGFVNVLNSGTLPKQRPRGQEVDTPVQSGD